MPVVTTDVESLQKVLKLLNHPSLDGSEEVNDAYNIIENIIDDAKDAQELKHGDF